MKLIIHLIDGNTMEFTGKFGTIGTKIQDGFYIIAIEEEERCVQINTQFVLYIERMKA